MKQEGVFHQIKIIACHVLIWMGVVLYIVCGAAIFVVFEGHIISDSYNRTVVEEEFRELVQLKDNFLSTAGNFSADELEEELDLLLIRMNEVLSSSQFTVDDVMSGKFPETSRNWDLLASIFFCFTIITTIGYGQLYPLTMEGKVFCIAYGLVGIPLTLIALADLGTFIVNGIKKLWNLIKLALYLCFNRKEEEDSKGHKNGLLWGMFFIGFFIFFICAAALLFPLWESLHLVDGFYFSFITLSTIGFGDYYPVERDYYILSMIIITIGLAITTSTIDLLADGFRKVHYMGAKIKDVRNTVLSFGAKQIVLNNFLLLAMEHAGIPDPEQTLNKVDLDEAVADATKNTPDEERLEEVEKGPPLEAVENGKRPRKEEPEDAGLDTDEENESVIQLTMSDADTRELVY